jgi:hypothetical protein
MVTVASDFLIMLNGKWSSQKFQDEQINDKFGVAFSDGDICIFCYNINVESIPSHRLYLNDSILKETKFLKISNNV